MLISNEVASEWLSAGVLVFEVSAKIVDKTGRGKMTRDKELSKLERELQEKKLLLEKIAAALKLQGDSLESVLKRVQCEQPKAGQLPEAANMEDKGDAVATVQQLGESDVSCPTKPGSQELHYQLAGEPQRTETPEERPVLDQSPTEEHNEAAEEAPRPVENMEQPAAGASNDEETGSPEEQNEINLALPPLDINAADEQRTSGDEEASGDGTIADAQIQSAKTAAEATDDDANTKLQLSEE